MSKLTFGATLSPLNAITSKSQTNNSKILANGVDTLISNSYKTYTVNLAKREYGGFGFLIRQRNEPPYFSIWEIIKDGSAEKNGQISKGDIILKVNREDLSEVGYERGLEILKSIKPGSYVELTLQKVDESLAEQVDLIDLSNTKNNLTNKSSMSPLQRFKKKFISCASPKVPSEHPISTTTEKSSNESRHINGHVVNNHIKLESKIKNSNEIPMEKEQRPTFFNSPLVERRSSMKNSTPNVKQAEKKDEPTQEKPLEITNQIAPLDNFDKYLNTMIDKKSKRGLQSNEEADSVSPKVTSIRSKTLDTINLNQNLLKESKLNEEKKIMEKSETSPTKLNLASVSKSRSMTVKSSHTACNSPKCKYKQAKVVSNQNGKNSTIQIVQDGDDIRINIDGNIEIVTNRFNDKKIISLSPRVMRKMSSGNNKPDSINRHESSQIHEKENNNTSKEQPRLEDENKTTFPNDLTENPFESPENNDVKEAFSDQINSQDKIDSISPTECNKNEEKEYNDTEVETDIKHKKSEDDKYKELNGHTIDSMVMKVIPSLIENETLLNSPILNNSKFENDNKLFKVSTKNLAIPLARNNSFQSQRTDSVESLSSNTLQKFTSNETIANKSLKKKGVKLKFLIDESSLVDTLHQKANEKIACTSERCMGSMLLTSKLVPKNSSKPNEKLINQAVDFINQFYASVKREGSKTHKERVAEVISSINQTNSYELKETELCFGARTAWRNAPRCIGRIQWSKLQVFDARYVTTARGMFEAMCNHLKYVTNKGNIRSAITIFKQRTDIGHDFRVWNPQFTTYAGYKIDDKTVIGDKNQIEFTQVCIKLGWKPKYTEYDVLPLVLQANGQDPEWFELPSELILEVEILHPKFNWFKDLHLKWYCVPGVSSMMLDMGGIEFTACPFNGWYMGTEIGRDLADVNRYNKLPLIAEKMGLDINSNFSLWRDKALIELNYAILYSFQKANITITDHHTAAESFMKHYENENHLRGGCPADWVWVVPPLSSHLTPVFHLEMLNYSLKPSYEYQNIPWRTHVWKQKAAEKIKRNKRRVYFSDIARAVKFSAKLMGKALAKRVKCTILYATETGKSERFAKSLAEIFKHAFDAKTLCMKDYDVVDIEHETLLLIVTSTFGNGDPPENGEEFKKIMCEMAKDKILTNKRLNIEQDKFIYEHSGPLSNVRFSIFGLGNSSYPKFCSYAKFLDNSLNELGADRIYELGLGDELCGQEESFRKWSIELYKSALVAFCIDVDNAFIESLSKESSEWTAQTSRLTIVNNEDQIDLCETLSKFHSRKIFACKLANKRNLNKENSGRVTLCVELNTQTNAGELQYKPGDHIGIMASNRKELVDVILSKVTNAPSPDQLVRVEVLREKTNVFGVSKQWVKDEHYPDEITLRTAFTNFLDITSPPTQKMLMYLALQASEESDRSNLEKLAKDHLAYEEWKLDSYPNLVEVLNEFNSVKPNATLLLTQLPKLQARFYSISSSPKVTDQIDLTLGVVEYTLKGKSVHYGVCSKWLDEMNIGETIPTFIRGAPSFRLPEDKSVPIIMVGAGTGIAPFRSFWQERKIDMEMMPTPQGINGTLWGEMILYFGCRQAKVDELYKNELDQLINERVITELHSAYSREPGKPKVYVQDLLEKNMQSVFDAIYNKKGHFYVCGDVRMASKVTQTLELTLQKKNNMTIEEAKEYVFQMKEELRFHEDIFGNSINIINN